MSDATSRSDDPIFIEVATFVRAQRLACAASYLGGIAAVAAHFGETASETTPAPKASASATVLHPTVPL